MIAARMAYRNLFLHKAKSLLMGGIMCAGIAVLFIGNSLIDTTIQGLKRMFVQGYTGDLMVTGPTVFPTTIFGETAGGEEVLPHIAKFPEYEKYLESDARVSGTLPMLSGQVAMGLGEQVIGRGSAFGVDIGSYRNFFSGNVTLSGGEWPSSGDQSWILLSENSASMLSRTAGQTIGPGSKIVLSALGDTAGTVIREVKVSGIVRFEQSNNQLAGISLVDADTMRDLLGFASLRDGAVSLTPQQAKFVESFDPEALFMDDSVMSGTFGTETDSASGFGDSTDAAQAPIDGGASQAAPEPPAAWQFILVKLAKGANALAVQKDLTAFASSVDLGDHVQDWIAGAGSIARTAVTIRLVFDLMVSIVAVVVIMITMNVLVVSIGERVGEIGTLRALGARKSFVRRMILMETSFLALLAGAAGLFVGFVALIIAGRTGIAAPNLFFEALFAGRKLVPAISAGAALRAFLWIFGMSIFSSLYPIALALRIKPVKAMQAD